MICSEFQLSATGDGSAKSPKAAGVLRAFAALGVAGALALGAESSFALSFMVQPTNQVVRAGTQRVTLRAAADSPAQYQWFFNGSTLYGATNSVLGFAEVKAWNSGEYWVKASDGTNQVISEAVKLLVPFAQPVYTESFSTTPGAEWSSTALGATDEGHRRYLGPLSNEVLSLSLTDLPAHSDVVVFLDLLVFGDWTGLDSVWSILNLAESATIWKASFDTRFGMSGATQSYPAQAGERTFPAGLGAIETASIPVRRAVYPIRAIFPHQGSEVRLGFEAAVRDAGASWGIDNVVVSICNVGEVPAIEAAWMPIGGVVLRGQTVVLEGGAGPSAQVRYTWNRNGIPLPSGKLLVLSNLGLSDGGLYHWWLVVEIGSMGPFDIPITVVEPLPTEVSAEVGESIVLSVATTEASSLAKYGWSFNGRPIPGATSPRLNLDNLTPERAGEYSVNVANFHGSVDVATRLMVEFARLGIVLDPEPNLILEGTRNREYEIQFADRLGDSWQRLRTIKLGEETRTNLMITVGGNSRFYRASYVKP